MFYGVGGRYMVLQMKNKIILRLGLIGIGLAILIQFLHSSELMNSLMGSHHSHTHIESGATAYGLILLAFVIWIINFTGIRKGKNEKAIAFSNTFLLSIICIAVIAAGHGMMVYHFSLFMMLAVISFYEDIRLILLMSIIFTVQHLVGFFVPLTTPYVFGDESITFTMLIIHALFLVLTSSATIWQTLAKKRFLDKIEQEKQEQEQKLQNLLTALNKSSEQVSQTTSQLQEQMQRTKLANVHVSDAIQEGTSHSGKQSETMKRGSRIIEEMGVKIQEISQKAHFVNERSSSSSKKAEEGVGSVSNMTNQMKQIQGSVQDMATRIKDLEKESKEIEKIISTISKISEQTNLLALNASIEAARSGEHGKGFAVVADEVRNLAEQTAEAANKVAVLVQTIQKRTHTVSQSANNGLEEVTNGLKVIEQVGLSFTEIFDTTRMTAKDNAEMTEALTYLSQSSEEMLQSIHAMGQVTLQIVGLSSRIVDANDEQTLSLEEIETIINNLNALVENLNAYWEESSNS